VLLGEGEQLCGRFALQVLKLDFMHGVFPTGKRKGGREF
jgi:hypothetical protein